MTNLYPKREIFIETIKTNSLNRIGKAKIHFRNYNVNDDKIDYIKVMDNVDGDNHLIVLQVAVNEKENQDVAVFSVSKDENKQINIQLIARKNIII
jgi:hypothetical protein